jgi:hypothetical protein
MRELMAGVYNRWPEWERTGAVHAAALAVLGDPVRAQDVVQDVFLRLWRRPEALGRPAGRAHRPSRAHPAGHRQVRVCLGLGKLRRAYGVPAPEPTSG